MSSKLSIIKDSKTYMKMFIVRSRNSKFLYLLSTKFIFRNYAKYLLLNKKRFTLYIAYWLKDEAGGYEDLRWQETSFALS